MGISKFPPKSEARPLGTPSPKGRRAKTLRFVQTSAPAVPIICPRCGESLPDGDAGKRECLSCYWTETASPETFVEVEENNSTATDESTCNPETDLVESSQSETAMTPPTTLVEPVIKDRVNLMKLSLKTGERKGSSVVYTVEGRRGTVKFAAALFADADEAPKEIELPDDGFADAKRKLTKEEKAALPKKTLAERIAEQDAKLAKLRAKAAKAQEAELQPSL